MQSLFEWTLLLAALVGAGWVVYLLGENGRVQREGQEAKLNAARLEAEKKAAEADLDTACQQLSNLLSERERIRADK